MESTGVLIATFNNTYGIEVAGNEGAIPFLLRFQELQPFANSDEIWSKLRYTHYARLREKEISGEVLFGFLTLDKSISAVDPGLKSCGLLVPSRGSESDAAYSCSFGCPKGSRMTVAKIR